jgi:hypothetical protein
MARTEKGRKPPGVRWETWIDQQIAEGMRNGQFDNLPGTGKPLAGLDGRRDEDWWLKAKLREERLSYLPPTLRIRKEAEEARAAIAAAQHESTVRRILEEINAKIRDINRRGADGPPSSMMPLDEQAVVDAWRAARQPE